jgi:F-type H+-transporting ATPase subunit delta
MINHSNQLTAILDQLSHNPDPEFVASLETALINSIDQKNQSSAIVETAIPLSNDDERQLRSLVSKRFPSSKSVSFIVDTAILGGVRIRLGDEVIDFSLISQINKLKSTFA